MICINVVMYLAVVGTDNMQLYTYSQLIALSIIHRVMIKIRKLQLQLILVFSISLDNGPLIWYTNLFPDNNAVNISNASCCDTETINSSCSLKYCDCSVEDQINCYITETNLNRLYIVSQLLHMQSPIQHNIRQLASLLSMIY